MSNQLHHRPITRRVVEAVRRHMRMKVVDFAAFRAGHEQAKALQNSVTPKEQLAKTHPARAAYVYAQNQMSIMAEQLLQMPEVKSFVKRIGPAEDEYAPSWPPRDAGRRDHRRLGGMRYPCQHVGSHACAPGLEDGNLSGRGVGRNTGAAQGSRNRSRLHSRLHIRLFRMDWRALVHPRLAAASTWWH